MLRDLEAEFQPLAEPQAALDAGVAAPAPARRPARRRDHRRLATASRTSTRPSRRHRRPAAGERPRHGARADHARLLRDLDRPWQRHRRPRDGRQARPYPGAAGAADLYASPRLAHRRGSHRAITTASPTKACGRSAISPTCGRCSGQPTGSTTARSTQSFADAVVEEANSDDPIILVQDYHFALLPKMIREPCRRRPSSPSGTSPGRIRNPSASVPGARRSSRACSAASILGFHTQFHCNNFLETVDRFLEARIDRETFDHLLPRRQHAGAALSDLDRMAAGAARRRLRRRRVPRHAFACASTCRADARLGVGVDRFDYTKGILERFTRSSASSSSHPRVDRPLHLPPGCRAHARTHRRLPDYAERVTSASAEINAASAGAAHQPIILLVRAPRARGGLRAIPRRRSLHRLQPARRHEPRRQGVRCRARRRARRAHPVAVHRRRRAS